MQYHVTHYFRTFYHCSSSQNTQILRSTAVRTTSLMSTIYLSITNRSLNSFKGFNCLMSCVMAHHLQCFLSDHPLISSPTIQVTNFTFTLASSSPLAPFFRTRKAAGLSACTLLLGNWNTSSLCASPIAGEMNSLYGESGMCWSLNLIPTRYSPET